MEKRDERIGEREDEIYQDGEKLCKEKDERIIISFHLYISAFKFSKHFHILFEFS